MIRKHFSKIIALLTCLVLAASFAACGKRGKDGNDLAGTKNYIGEKTVGGNTVKIYGDGDGGAYKSVSFEETNDLCADNEGMGWDILEEPLLGGLPSVGYLGNFPEVKNISLSTGWSVVEKTPGVYDWSVIDESVEYWASQGKYINLRLCTDGLTLNQGVIYGCPGWLFDAPYNVPKIINEGQIYADISNKVYLDHLETFLAEFASHFMDDDYTYRDMVDVVELRGYGMVGEWHSGWNTYTTIEERAEGLCNIIDMWREAWGDEKLLVVSCTYEFIPNMPGALGATNYEDFMYWMGYDHALTLDNISFRRDGIAFALREWDERMATDYFYLNTGLPLLGEIGGGYHTHGDDSQYPLFEALNEALHKWRVNYQTVIGWVAQDFITVLEKERELMDYFGRLMGYRIVPDTLEYSKKVKAGDKLYANGLFTNKAMGRCWTDYDFSVYLENANGETVYTGTDASFNPIAINGGEPHFFDMAFDLPATLAAGEYTLKFAISDSKGNPKIEMPIAGNDGNKKYYLGEVTVGAKAAESKVKKDDIDTDTAFKPVNNGKITNRLVNVDGTKALVGGGSKVFALGDKLENGKTYYVSFDYKVDKPKTEITINDTSRYAVGAYSERGEAFGDSYTWLDVSGKVSHRSTTIKVPDDGKKYVLAFGGINNVADIAVDNVRVALADTVTSDFRVNPSYTEATDDGYMIKSTVPQNWAEGLQLKEKLDPHAAYMITFDAKTVTDVGTSGGFFYVTMNDPKVSKDDSKAYIESFSLNRIGSFLTPVNYGFVKQSFVFNSGDYTEDWRLVLGVRNVGAVEIKNITLTKLNEHYSYTSDGVVIARNVVPKQNIDLSTAAVTENFESGSFHGGVTLPGGLTKGILTADEDIVINGKYSCYISNDNPTDTISYEFNEFCRTNMRAMPFEANTAYRIKFKFKIIEDGLNSEQGYFYCLARKDGSFSNDVGVFEWNKTGGTAYKADTVYSVQYDFKTGNFDNYFFMWGVRLYGALAIDDIIFEKVDSVTQVTPVVTEGHAYTVSNEVLFTR